MKARLSFLLAYPPDWPIAKRGAIHVPAAIAVVEVRNWRRVVIMEFMAVGLNTGNRGESFLNFQLVQVARHSGDRTCQRFSF